MPRYDYQCLSCEREFELTQSFSEAGSGVCPTCSGKGRRVFHAVPVIYKGSGFYTTDYGRPKAPPDEGAKDGKDSKSSEASSDKSSSSTSDSKSETSSETSGKAASETKS